MITKKVYKIAGMHCVSCATMIEFDLEDAGIPCKCSYVKSTLEIEGDHDSHKVVETVKKSGYSISPID